MLAPFACLCLNRNDASSFGSLEDEVDGLEQQALVARRHFRKARVGEDRGCEVDVLRDEAVMPGETNRRSRNVVCDM